MVVLFSANVMVFLVLPSAAFANAPSLFILRAWPSSATAHVKTTLDANAFAYYSVAHDKWLVEGGDYEIHVGANSADTPLCIAVKLPRK